MTYIPYHTIRNFVNTSTQHLSPDASERAVSRLPLRNPITPPNDLKRSSVRCGEPHGAWNGNEMGGYWGVQAAVWLLGVGFQFQNGPGRRSRRGYPYNHCPRAFSLALPGL